MQAYTEDFLVLDCESSGLSDESYPIEIGIKGPGDQSWFFMICPMEDWDHWDAFAAEAIHGIERDQLLAQGRDAFLVARELNAIFKGRTLYCDSTWDQFWIKRLFDDSGVTCAFTLTLAQDLMTEGERAQYDDWLENTTMTHRPVQDAQAIREFLQQGAVICARHVPDGLEPR